MRMSIVMEDKILMAMIPSMKKMREMLGKVKDFLISGRDLE